MDILVLEPFFGGSHKQFWEGFQERSRHQVHLLTLPPFHWKWRMRGAAMSLAQQLEEQPLPADLLFCSDYLPVADFLCLAPSRYRNLPVAIYMHENQLTYPVPPGENLDFQFGVTNVVSCLAANRVYFNSHYHRDEFLQELPVFLKRFPDYVPRFAVTRIEETSEVLTLGCDLASLDAERVRGMEWKRKANAPVLLWNHRWEFDKNPEDFFGTLFRLKEQGSEFQLIVAGERATQWPVVFDEASERLEDEILSFGPLPSRAEYAAALWAADVAISTSEHDFFGVSVIEAMYCGCYPLLPNRLSYPEHIPDALHGRHLYLHRENLLTKLRALLRHGPIEPDAALLEAAAGHDWGRRIDDYDDRLERVAQTRQS